MSFSMFDASVPAFSRSLRALEAILARAEAHAVARKIDPAVLLGARLFPDMLPLTRQVQIATDHAKGAVARLTATEVPRFADDEQSFAELRARVAKTLQLIAAATPAGFEGAEAREIAFRLGPHDLSFTGAQYLTGFALPNFYFHLATAYGILRHNGVELGKQDFLGRD
ncbi:MAG: DUF1993 domain-containing protein [Candidatus Dactylopiibacterium sp.]|nr:DUF1993 domain-containing protein [Candidatus Dactylopiibacterium sp.]